MVTSKNGSDEINKVSIRLSDTHNINVQNFFKESRNLIGTATVYAYKDWSKNCV